MSLRLNGSTSGYTEIDAPAVAGSNSIVLPNGNGSANQFLKNGSTAGTLGWSSMVEDGSGRLLVGTTSSIGPNSDQIQCHTSGGNNYGLGRFSASAGGPDINFYKSRSATIGTSALVQSGDTLGILTFAGADGVGYQSAASISAIVDGTPSAGGDMPGRLVFSTTADGASSPTERMRLENGGAVRIPGVYNNTTASAVNVHVASDGTLLRSTSSAKYKTDIETIQDSYADALLQCRPVWYRSTSSKDNPTWGWWGFIAEEVAEIDPRLVFWKTEESVAQEDGSLVTVPLDQPEPEGVQYDRFVPHLLNLIKRQQAAIESLEARIAALEVTP